MKCDLSKAMLVVAACAICVPAGFAQTSTTTSSTTTTNPPTINQRKDNQQQRIGNGVENGSLTAGETRSLERQESDVNKEEHQMKALDNGKLTQGDRAVLNQQQNQGVERDLSGQAQRRRSELQGRSGSAAAQSAGAHWAGYQEWSANGPRIGAPGESAGTLEQGNYNDRAANGGKLTPAERKQVNHQENKTSKAIYDKKHNGRTR